MRAEAVLRVIPLALLAASCAASAPPHGAADPVDARPVVDPADAVGPRQYAPPSALRGGTYLTPNVEDADGTPGFLHVTESDMPLVVSIDFPPEPPNGGSRADARRVSIEAMQQWEDAIAPHVPWFALEFVEEDPDAAVQVIWRRRMLGPWGGFGGLRFQVDGVRVRIGGMMELSTTPAGAIDIARLTLEDVRRIVAHEFGHVLGLGHCLDCDSAMNYSWETQRSVIVTEVDVRTFLALLARPNGTRVDGSPLRVLEAESR